MQGNDRMKALQEENERLRKVALEALEAENAKLRNQVEAASRNDVMEVPPAKLIVEQKVQEAPSAGRSFWSFFGFCSSSNGQEANEVPQKFMDSDEPLKLYDGQNPNGMMNNGSYEERDEVGLEEGARYKGQWSKTTQQIEGKGILWHADGSIYEGDFVGSRAEGQGRLTHASGSLYEGQWVANKAHGRGKWIAEDGSSYEGEWAEDEKNGTGVERWADGSIYEGQFLHGTKHGQGVYHLVGGIASYKGQFTQGLMHGQGMYSFADGRKYEGQWTRGQMDGTGFMQWPDGTKYRGGYKTDCRHGTGTLTWPDGRMYRGQWSNGMQDGFGSNFDATGAERPGKFKYGQPVY